jgi:sterol desaturase/sphingolipid hydroxylase (fatty acid hydroxylase superfamily)
MSPQLPSTILTIAKLALWLAILVAIFVPLERLCAIHPRKIFRKEVGVDVGYYFLNSLLPAALMSLPVALLIWVVHRVVPEGLLATTAAWPLWLRASVGMVAGEIGYYWGHRLSHEIPFLWRFHAIHHSAEEVDFLVNSRAHPLDMVFGKFCGIVPIYILGLSGPIGTEGNMVVVWITLIGTVWGFFIHANLRWRFGPIEWLITTPAFHHWHHTLDGPINKNYASTLPWLDRIFGTHHLPAEFPEAYGIKAEVPDTLTEQLAYPLFAKIPSDQPSTPVATNPETVSV